MKSKKFLTALMVIPAVLMLWICGCSEQGVSPEKIEISSGAEQVALPSQVFAKALRITVKDANDVPCPNIEVSIKVKSGSDLILNKEKSLSDAGGVATFSITAGKKTGDQYLTVSARDCPDQEVRFVTGVEITGANQEAKVGENISSPIRVKLVNSDGTPAQGVKVYFNSHNGFLPEKVISTDDNGVASAKLAVGKKTGKCEVNISVRSEKNRFSAVKTQVFAVNYLQIAVNTLGGLALFIYGMSLMSNGLRHAAGEKLRGILRFFARNRIIGLLAGIGVTAAIQTSSGTTVMVVGFVNAGLMNLAQAISIMLGAHIGTTITAQLIAFKLDALIMPALIIGLLFSFIPRSKARGWSETILGFGLLFFGISLMGSELKSISEFPTFINFFRTFDCAPINGSMPPGAVMGAIFIGLLATVIIQSSSATSGIVIALCSGGLINFYTAVALIFGANIGTTITAILAAIPANRVAKQAALANTLCACFGVIVMTGLFWVYYPGTDIPVFLYFIDWLTAGNAFGEIPQNLPRHIANAHTVFNVATSLILLPFIGPLAKLVEKLLPATGEVKYNFLEPHLLRQPAIALEQTVTALRSMVQRAYSMVKDAGTCFIKGEISDEQINSLQKRESRIDKMQLEITNYLTKIMQHKLSAPQANVIPLLMHCTNDAERIADHTENIVLLIQRLNSDGNRISRTAAKELEDIFVMLSEQAALAVGLLEKYDPSAVHDAIELEKKIARLGDHFEDTHIQRLRDQTCNADTGVVFIEMLNEVIKISDRLSNIVERAGRINRSALGFRNAEAESDPIIDLQEE